MHSCDARPRDGEREFLGINLSVMVEGLTKLSVFFYKKKSSCDATGVCHGHKK